MENLKFDDGIKEFSINGNKNKTIKFNPSDTAILTRLEEIMEEFKSNKETNSAELDKKVRERINYAFGDDVSNVVFGKQSAVALVGSGKFLFQAFLECILPLFKEETEKNAKKIESNVKKYTDSVSDFK